MTRLAPTFSLLVVSAALASPPVAAQVASLVEDIESGPTGAALVSSNPEHFVRLGDLMLFAARHPSAGIELWATDGTASGTELLADTCPGGCSAEPIPAGKAGAVSFWAVKREDGSSDRLLWRSNGTRAGTFLLTSLATLDDVGDPRLEPGRFAVLGAKLFFNGCTARKGCALWTSDGTLAGTYSLLDFVGGAPIHVSSLTVRGNRLFFVGLDSAQQAKIWVTDGTPQGTKVVLSVTSGSPSALTAAPAGLFFVLGSELWITDGTAAGTRRATFFGTGPAAGGARWLKPSGGFVYFLGYDETHGQEIWRTDGTPSGLRRATKLADDFPFALDVEPVSWAALAGRLLFIATDGSNSARVWATTGDPSSTAPLTNACVHRCSDNFFEGRLLEHRRRIYFPAWDEAHGVELWSTDGTPGGTARVADVCPGTCSGLISGPAVVRDEGVFVASDRSDSPSRELWRTDGSAAGTRPFSALPPGVQLERTESK